MLSQLIASYALAKLFAHASHHLADGPTFFADHEFLGTLYEAYDDAFDSLAERAIGLGEKINHADIFKFAGTKLPALSDDVQKNFEAILKIEKQLCAQLKSANSSASLGTQNLLAGLADESEVRQYKIGQRLK